VVGDRRPRRRLQVLLLTLFDLPLERFWMWSFDLAGIVVIEIRGGRPLAGR
jgi:hypothetical protein